MANVEIKDVVTVNGYVVAKEVIEALIKEGKELLGQYQYTDGCYYPTDYVDFIIYSSIKAKAENGLIDAMSLHTNWRSDKLQIVFDSDYKRPILSDVVWDVFTWMAENAWEIGVSKEFHFVYTPAELDDIKYGLEDTITRGSRSRLAKIINKRDLDLVKEDYRRICILEESLSGKYKACQNRWFPIDTYNLIRNAISVFNYLKEYNRNNQFLSERAAERILSYFPDIKGITATTKTSKAVGKIARYIGLDKIEGYNQQFARLGDAINPLTITRHTILSCNPIDYWTMSFGDNWCSCHNIDKTHMRYSSKVGQYGDGCCSSGTESYMLDSNSIVFYTVDSKYDGVDYELQDKHNRQMFHIDSNGHKFIVQGRLYPQGNDGANEAYTEIREIVQKVFSDIWEVPNLWVNKKGTEECCKVIQSTGTHYTDYTHFDLCNVSYVKETCNEDEKPIKIRVGHNPICPGCGEEHYESDNIVCEDCQGGTFYCDYHEEYESVNEGQNEISGYGTVCDRALRNGNFHRCERCDEWFWEDGDNAICTSDGNWYCDSDCAERDGYVYVEREYDYYPSDEVGFCERCDDVYLLDSNDAIHTDDGHEFCCENCASENDYVEIDGNWYSSENVISCEECGQIVHIRHYNAQRCMCSECVENSEESESEE